MSTTRVKEWRDRRVRFDGDETDVYLRFIQCRRCVHWPDQHKRRAKAVCKRHARKVHMFYRCKDFSCDTEGMLAVVIDTMCADGVIERTMIKGVPHYRVVTKDET